MKKLFRARYKITKNVETGRFTLYVKDWQSLYLFWGFKYSSTSFDFLKNAVENLKNPKKMILTIYKD